MVPRTKSRGRRLLLSSCRAGQVQVRAGEAHLVSTRANSNFLRASAPAKWRSRTLDQSEGGISGPDLSPIRKRFRFEGRARSFSVADPPRRSFVHPRPVEDPLFFPSKPPNRRNGRHDRLHDRRSRLRDALHPQGSHRVSPGRPLRVPPRRGDLRTPLQRPRGGFPPFDMALPLR